LTVIHEKSTMPGMAKKRLITSALPYVNNIPHLGNLIQVLSADVFARFCRLAGYDTLYICGTDEYGTATETRALEEGITPKELCDRYYAVHTDIYSWFNIAFDRFGRTSIPEHTRITQDIFKGLDRNGYIREETTTQLFCEHCDRFLADRYVRGTCPHCGYEEARGDQCESCGKLLDPTELVSPACGVCGGTPVLRETRHLYIDLPAIRPRLEAWMDRASVEGFWANNAVRMTRSWIRDGLKQRCITRDLKWGIPVPKEGFRDKVFYVWFDAPIGYISMTAAYTDAWEDWWKNPDNVELFQFLGKDNIPFHTVVFPSSLLGSGENWTMLHHMSSSEYLNYESGKFSKSRGVGVFGSDAKNSGIPADVWRFYIFYNRPEKSDALFSWKDFQEKLNGELIGNLANLVNRTLSFLIKNYGSVPEADPLPGFMDTVTDYHRRITEHLERAELRDAFREIFALSSFGNKTFQEAEPWKYIKNDPAKAAPLMRELVYLLRDLAVLTSPFIPETAEKIASFLGNPDIHWASLGDRSTELTVRRPEILFNRLEDKEVDAYRDRFAGKVKDRDAEKEESPEDYFRRKIDLRAAKITSVEKHPDADTLYILSLDAGGEERVIVSGLVDHYSPEELDGRTIILVYNLKPAKLRGVKSRGMLLAADDGNTVDVLFLDGIAPGTPVVLEGDDPAKPSGASRLSIDGFFKVPMRVENGVVRVGETALAAGGSPVHAPRVTGGSVG